MNRMKPRKTGEVIEEFDVTDRDGKKHHVAFRYPKMSDLDGLLKFVGAIVKESEFLEINKKPTRKEEIIWLKDNIDGVKKGKTVMLVVTVNGIVSGNGEVRGRKGNSSHVGEIGISLRNKYTDIGIGSRLMVALEREAKAAGIELLKLGCYRRNARARHVYAKMGFKEAGIIPKIVKKNGKYDDGLIMYKILV